MLTTLDGASLALARRSHAGGPDPAAQLPWPRDLDPTAGWCTAPELVSLHGTEAWSSLAADGQRRLAFHEAVRFFAVNVHGERSLIAALVPYLGRGDGPRDAYLFHLVEEEARHTQVFARFCHRFGGGLPRSRRVALGDTATDATAELMAFAQVLIFEELVDAHDRPQARDPRLVTIVRAIHAYHHADEARHRAFGRRIVQELAGRARRAVSAAHWREVQQRLAGFLQLSWREFEDPRAYHAAGLPDPAGLARLVREHSAPRARRRALSSSATRFLLDHDLLDGEPDL